VVVPLQTALGRFPQPAEEAELSEVQVALPAPELVVGQVAVAQALLARLHRDQPDVELVVPLRLLEQSQAQQRIFNLVMGLIAGISLLVGGIGIMNIMLASVMERTREIGVRMAIGATQADIRRLFLVESGLISLLGGVLGILVGVAISRAVAAATGWTTAVGIDAVLLAAVLSMAEGVVFGFIPARRAAMLPPAIAVRQVG
jgi:putative ABC transport system permease protein